MLKNTILLVAGGLLFAASTQAQLVHRYDMNSANDSVGTSNGTLQGGATIANGVLTVNGANNGTGSGATAGTLAQALALPSSVGTGITGSFSLEFYATRTTTDVNYSSVFSFSNSQANLLLFNPSRGNNTGTNFDLQQAGVNNGAEYDLAANPNANLFADGLQHDVVVTYNATTGVASVYNNGALFSSGTYATGFSFASSANGVFDGIGGNGPYSDPSFNGTIADFRIFSQALTQGQVTTLDGLGADASNGAISAAVPEPSAWTAALAGLGALFALQRVRRLLA